MNAILVIAPHPDDETLGCGGTLLRHTKNGESTHWLIMTEISEAIGYSVNRIKTRAKEIENVSQKYDFKSVHNLGFPTTQLDEIPKKELITAVSQIFNEIKPNTIYLPYRSDIHSDHKIVFDVVASCTKSFRYPFIKKIRVYETLSETKFGIRPDDSGFHPNLWIDISEFLDKKIEIMKLYNGEMGNPPFPRSEQTIKALATLRGSTAGCIAAEAFISLKEIID